MQFTAPMRSAAGSSSSRTGITACLCGMVTFAPATPSTRNARIASGGSVTRHGAYTASIPRSWNARVWTAGEREWAIGSPRTR